uniref:Na_H_Exchanger domain-containing protein n=1 Tax=Ascaris lumbricoides TaxID=6252 RepID=A0A0M3IGG8_ASCLU
MSIISSCFAYASDAVSSSPNKSRSRTIANSLKKTRQKSHLAVLVLSFGISFLAFIGSTHILFYYLKFRFSWDAALYGLLKGPLQVIVLDAFSRFAATGLRAMMANSVMPEDHGSLFALIAITEAGCNLIAAVVFHMLSPVSIPILPQISFVILASLLLIPLWLIWSRWGDLSMVVDRQSQDTELKTIEIGEDPERLEN